MAKLIPRGDILDMTPEQAGELTFDEIAQVLDIPTWEAEKIFDKALKKLSSPRFARKLWQYKKIGDCESQFSDMAGTSH